MHNTPLTNPNICFISCTSHSKSCIDNETMLYSVKRMLFYGLYIIAKERILSILTEFQEVGCCQGLTDLQREIAWRVARPPWPSLKESVVHYPEKHPYYGMAGECVCFVCLSSNLALYFFEIIRPTLRKELTIGNGSVR